MASHMSAIEYHVETPIQHLVLQQQQKKVCVVVVAAVVVAVGVNKVTTMMSTATLATTTPPRQELRKAMQRRCNDNWLQPTDSFDRTTKLTIL